MAKTSDELADPPTTTGKARTKRAGQKADNAIRPVKRRPPVVPAEPGSRAVAPQRSSGSPTVAKKGTTAPTANAVPPEIWERFIGIGAKYYFPDGTPAFVDRGVKLTTPSENTEVIRSLITIAQARDWQHISVSGTQRFRKEAWFAAQRVGITVRGYKPSEIEQAQLVRGLAEGRGTSGRQEHPNTEGRASTSARGARSGATPERAREGTDSPDGRRGTLFVGRLLDHGRDTYRHDPREQSSYFVKLQTPEGEREIWGVDLERALRDSLSNARAGDDITVRAVSREAVTVPKRERDIEGRVIGESSVSTHRNEWIVERTEFLAGRESAARTFRDTKISPQEAVKKHPELQGSYLKLQAVKLGAERDFKNLADRERLLVRARVLIAQSIERGEPLEPVRLREPVAKKPEKEHEIKPELQRAR
jgi:conjugative element/phage-associated large polyvalent protein